MTTPTREELKAKYGYERVGCVYRNDFNHLQEGYNPYNPLTLKKIESKLFFARRYNVEYQPKYRQIIPYVVIRHGNQLFTYKRLINSGEARLVGGWSIGTGGHTNPVDQLLHGSVLHNNIIRELSEELDIYPNAKRTYMIAGFINDNSNEVSQDHLGILVIMDISKPNMQVRETDKLQGEFMSIDTIKQNYDKLEAWSKVALDAICNMMKQTQ